MQYMNKESKNMNETKKNKTFRSFVFTEKKDIMEFFECNEKVINVIKDKYEKNNEFMLVLGVDSTKKDATVVLLEKESNYGNFTDFLSGYIDIDSALYFLRYSDEEEFLSELNEFTTEENSLEV